MPARPPIGERESRAAAELLAWARATLGRTAARDVYCWRSPGGTLRLAIAGDARGLYRKLGFAEGSRVTNRGRWLDLTIAAALGVEMEELVERGAVVGVDPDLTHLDHHDRLGPGEFLESIDRAVAFSLGLDEPQEVESTVIPDPGHPWDGPGTTYYSAARRSWVTPERPRWELTGEAAKPGELRRSPRPVADWCALARRSADAPAGAGVSIPGEPPIFVTHTFVLDATWPWREAARGVARCGGLLFPSLAVGPIPASNFGPCSLFADPSIVTRGLSRRGASERDAVLYATDAYTATTARLVGEMAARLYDELTGRTSSDTYMFGGEPHLYALGPPADADGPVGNRVVRTEDGMRKALAARFKVWGARGPLGPDEFARADARSRRGASGLGRSAHEFAYLEAKASTVVPMGAFPLAVVPDFASHDYRWFLRACGHRGDVLVRPCSAAEREAFGHAEMPPLRRENIVYNYAWSVAGDAARWGASR